MKRIFSMVLTLVLLLSFSTGAFASKINGEPAPTPIQIQKALNSEANNLESLVSALNSGLEVSESNPVDTYTFEDGSYIQLKLGISDSSTSDTSSFALASTQKTGKAELSGYSAVTGENLLLYRYTMTLAYISNGTSTLTYLDYSFMLFL